jgi:outer membrane protein OmpA-like peptidoglycan-associated protein
VGSASLSAGQDDLVNKIVAAIQLFPTAEVSVEGHTDNTGGHDANLRLSRRRAETVARILEQKLGRGEESIATEGFGPDQPIALNSTAEGRAMNRRIDVVIATNP